MGRLRDFLKRITGVSTPIGGISWLPPPDEQKRETLPQAGSRPGAHAHACALGFYVSGTLFSCGDKDLSEMQIRCMGKAFVESQALSITMPFDLSQKASSREEGLSRLYRLHLVLIRKYGALAGDAFQAGMAIPIVGICCYPFEHKPGWESFKKKFCQYLKRLKPGFAPDKLADEAQRCSTGKELGQVMERYMALACRHYGTRS